MLRKIFSLTALIILISLTTSFAVTNAKINGQKEVTITQLPVDLIFTCDLAAVGNRIAVEYYVDIDNNGAIGGMEDIVEFLYLTDGIGWIRDPQDPENDFPGDETGVDGKIQTTFTISPEDVFMPTGLTALVRVVDEDGSSEILKLHLQITPQPPFIQGKVTDKSSGTPIPNVFVLASLEGTDNDFYGISDNNGNYKIPVPNGTFSVFATQFPSVDYQPSDTMTVVVSGDQSVTQDFQLEPFPSKIQGKLTMQNGTGVPGILVVAIGLSPQKPFFSFATSDAQGNYSLGAIQGRVVVSAPFFMNMMNESWPADHYTDPAADTIDVVAGQTYTSDFVFKPYTAFVTGKCTVNGQPLAGVAITGVSFNLQTFALQFYMTTSGSDGNYRLGVLPGVLTTLTASKEGYQMLNPPTGYLQVTVLPGQTVTGKDFVMQALSPSSISGTVTFSDGSPAPNVYVAAENFFEESPEGFLITYTDASGNFMFNNVMDGEYHMGVFHQGYSSNPPMRTFIITLGMPLSNQDFVLSSGSAVEWNITQSPGTYQLFQNYPNPFNPTTQIRFNLPQTENVSLMIFNSAGQLVRVLENGKLKAGIHEYQWDGLDQFGNKVGSGIYFYQLKTDHFKQVKRMILTK